MKCSLVVLVLAGIVPYHCFSQVWVEDYQFNGTDLDSQKWTFSSAFGSPTLTFNGSSMNITMPTSWFALRPSSILWHQSLPLSQSWSIFQRFKSNLIEPRTSWMNVVVAKESLFTRTQYFSNGLENSVSGNGDSLGMISNLADDIYYWMGISHDAASKKIINFFSLTSTSTLPHISDIQEVGNSVSTIGNENQNVDIGVSWGFLNKGSYDLTDFRIVPYSVPEPSSLSLLLAGGAVLMAGRRRK